MQKQKNRMVSIKNSTDASTHFSNYGLVWYAKIATMNWVDGSSGDSYYGICAYIHWKTHGGSKLVVLFENMCKQPGEDDSLAPELKLFPYLAIQSLNGDYQLLVPE